MLGNGTQGIEMKPFNNFNGTVAPLDRVNVDTDQIIPKQFLKLIERTGFGKYLFYDWRFASDGKLNNQFILNQPRYKGASILLARANFGCGSSREHAVWALEDYGFRVLIAPSYADIFHNNCFKNGILPISLDPGEVDALFNEVTSRDGYTLGVDLENQTVTKPDGEPLRFKIDPFTKKCLLEGLDDISLTLQHEEEIRSYESRLSPFQRIPVTRI
jgi:3-isopropylmalate/(R)-2-methylmalate dehydratase small subunit